MFARSELFDAFDTFEKYRRGKLFLAMRSFQEESSLTVRWRCRTKKGCGRSRSSELLPALALGTNSSVVFKNETFIYENINFMVFRAKKREKKLIHDQIFWEFLPIFHFFDQKSGSFSLGKTIISMGNRANIFICFHVFAMMDDSIDDY